jgi:hypothetical protein
VRYQTHIYSLWSLQAIHSRSSAKPLLIYVVRVRVKCQGSREQAEFARGDTVRVRDAIGLKHVAPASGGASDYA